MDLAVPIDSKDHVLGPSRAAVTIVEYGDFECPICKQAAHAVDVLLQRFADRVRFAYRHFPLEDPHPHALSAAEASECAASQGKFWDMHRILFDNQDRLTADALRAYARGIGLDMDRFGSEMQTREHLPSVRRHIESGRLSRVRSTPGFFVEGKIVDVSFGMQSLFDATEAAMNAR
jgi:protein-disulfide isomerase